MKNFHFVLKLIIWNFVIEYYLLAWIYFLPLKKDIEMMNICQLWGFVYSCSELPRKTVDTYEY